jgi:phosphoribosylformylglycinamidine cyclo-ligase
MQFDRMSDDADRPPMAISSAPTGLSYRASGVDIDAGDRLVENIKPFAKRTMRPEVLAGIGGFGALVGLPSRYREPELVSGTDGVGTKLKLAFELNRHDTIGIDLVAMSVNDILVQGAEPLFFLDYFVCERLDVAVATDVIKGIARGCELAGCALIGGETAEHPNAFIPGEYDLAGFAVGVVEKTKAVDGTAIASGDVLLGLASSGPHSNGFSLIRKILERANADLRTTIVKKGPDPLIDSEKGPDPFFGATLGELLLEPTRIYVKPVLAVLEAVDVKGMAHITGGGLIENVHRMFPQATVAQIDRAAWPRPAIFDWLQQAGGVAEHELQRTFNCGIGFVLVVAESDADRAAALLAAHGETVYRIGHVRARNGAEAQTQVA